MGLTECIGIRRRRGKRRDLEVMEVEHGAWVPLPSMEAREGLAVVDWSSDEVDRDVVGEDDA